MSDTITAGRLLDAILEFLSSDDLLPIDEIRVALAEEIEAPTGNPA